MALTIPISELQDILGFPVPMEYRERYNICPGQPVLAVRRTESGDLKAEYLKWGLIPSWAKDKSIGYRIMTECR